MKKLIDLSGRGEEYTQDIDPEIRDLILELNEADLATTGSCAGHTRGLERLKGIEGQFVKSRPRGFILFAKKLNSDEITEAASIMRGHNITDYNFHVQGPISGGGYVTEVTFPPLAE